MPGFAERMGHRTARTLVQSDSLDKETRTELWNVAVLLRENMTRSGRVDPQQSKVLDAVWEREFKRARDERPSDQTVWGLVKEVILKSGWVDVLDLIEAIIRHLDAFPSGYDAERAQHLAEAYNARFEYFIVGYRFIGLQLTPVDSTAEAEAIVEAVDDAEEIAGARHALQRAVDLLADRQAPDYPNSIKESISAVEAVVAKITGQGTLGAGLNKLEAAGLKIHPALKAAWSKMYGWTSDEGGIRHAGIEAADVDQALAKYALVTCSAFVSYLTEEGRKTGLL